MSVFADRHEAVALIGGAIERYLSTEEAAEIAVVAASLSVAPVLELHLTDPATVLSIDFAARTVAEGRAREAAVRLQIPVSALHDVLLERLDPVQISRLFEEERAVAEGAPEALAALVRVSGGIARAYRPLLEASGRTDLLELPESPSGVIWQAEGPPRAVIGRRRPWQRPTRASAGTPA
jgi:hypothetical protein